MSQISPSFPYNFFKNLLTSDAIAAIIIQVGNEVNHQPSLAKMKNMTRIALAAACAVISLGSAHAQIYLLGGPSNVNDGNFSDGASTFTFYDYGYPQYQNLYLTGSTGTAANETWSVTNNFGGSFSGFANFGGPGGPGGSNGYENPEVQNNPTPPIILGTNGGTPTITTQEATLDTGITVGTVFTLDVYVAHNGTPNGTEGTSATPILTFNDGAVQMSLAPGSATENMADPNRTGDFTLQTFTYTAEGGDTTLDNLALTLNGSGQSYLAGVSLTASPEPSTWALLLAGAAGLVGLLRFRKANA